MRKILSAIATTAVLTCAIGLQCVGVALADDRVTELLSAAEKAGKGGDVLEAAAGFGKAAAAAQSRGDLQGESRVADGLSDFLDRVRPARVAENDETGDAPDRVDAVLAVMEQLDHRHLGAYVSVQSLARFLVDRSVSTGGKRALQQAADALATQAKNRKSGAGVRALATISATMLDSAAAAPLEESLDVCRKAGWPELAFVVAVETAARHVAMGDNAAAREVLDAVVGDLPADSPNETALRQRVRRVATARLRDAPKDVSAALEPLRAGGSAGAAGGAGGAGKAGGSGPRLSPVGDAWKKMSKSKPFVTARRSGDAAVVRHSFQKKFKEEVELDFGEHVQNDGGVALWFCGRYVALCMVDHSGRNGMPGGSSVRSSWRAWYLLRDGETWGVSKSGAVSIK